MSGLKQILVVDDHPYVLAGLHGSLRHKGAWQIELALGASEARERLAAEPGCFDAIVSDIHMPGGDGEALLRHVAAEYPLLRRIALTGDSGSEMAVRMRLLYKGNTSAPLVKSYKADA